VPADPVPPPTGSAGPAPGPPPAPRGAGAVARRWVDAVWAPTPASMRRIALAGVISTAGIILTGAAVRLSKSGLGCPDWPQCTTSSLVAAHTRGDPMFHTWIEFGNRLVTVVVTVVAVAVLVAAWRFRPGGPGARRRRDLVWLAAAQPAGIVAQIVLGGIVVLTKLNPATVSLHFMVSVAVVAAAVALHVKCTEGTASARPLVRPDLRMLCYGVVAVAAVMLTAGTVVTGTGPLAGAGDVPRYHLPLEGVTQFHADIGWLLGGLTVALVVGLHATRAPARVMRLGWLVLGLIGAQGVIGYTQYFSGLPAGLVWVHVAGSLLIWIAILRLMFAARDRGPLIPAPESPGGPAASARSEAQPALPGGG
jgi:heme A synthase